MNNVATYHWLDLYLNSILEVLLVFILLKMYVATYETSSQICVTKLITALCDIFSNER